MDESSTGEEAVLGPDGIVKPHVASLSSETL